MISPSLLEKALLDEPAWPSSSQTPVLTSTGHQTSTFLVWTIYAPTSTTDLNSSRINSSLGSGIAFPFVFLSF